MTNYREILRLQSLGINNTQIAESCGCSRTTVIKVLQTAAENGLKYPLSEEMTDRELSHLLNQPVDEKPYYKMPDYGYVHREMGKSGVTLTLLWLEYCEQCRDTGEIPYKSTQFNKYYNDYLNTTKATMHIIHRPGEILQVDWAGDTVHIINTDTGKPVDMSIFVATLPYSGYSYVEAFLSQNQENWIAANVNAFDFFGGVSRIIQCDNLKTGVVSNTKSETVLNKTYQEMAEHYGTAVIPCRVRTPKDKAYVEGTVGVISTWIIAALRNQQFLSLRELNIAIREKLSEFNNKPFQKKDGSRKSVFVDEEPFLLPLPKVKFELSVWKIATVQYNYHISVDGMNYSVPFEYIKQKVDIRLTRNVVEVFFDGNRVSAHKRLYGNPNQYSTLETHMPPAHQKYVSWNGERFVKWAAKIGDQTTIVVRMLLAAHKVEQQGYKPCMALLKLADKYSSERLEAACKKALALTSTPSLKSIQAILKSGQDRVNIDIQCENNEQQSLSSQYGFTRGAGYYKRRDD